MRGWLAGLAAVHAVACYRPSAPEAPCGPAGECPSGQSCHTGTCRSAAEELPDGDSKMPGDGGIDDAPLDAPQPLFLFSDPTRLDISSTEDDYGPSISGDELTLYFNSDRGGPDENFEIFASSRLTRNGPFGTPAVVPGLGMDNAIEYDPDVFAGGLAIVYVSDKPPYGLWNAFRATPSDPWSNVAPVGNLADREGPTLGVNDSHLLSASNGEMQEHVSGINGWSPSITHTRLANHEYPGMSTDGLEVFTVRFGHLYRATRSAIDVEFGQPQRVRFPSFDAQFVDPELSPDGSELYFSAKESGNADNDLYVAKRN